MLPVELGPLALAVRAARAANVRSFVPVQTEPAQDIGDPLLGPFDIAIAIGVLDAEEKRAVPARAPRLPVREQPVEKCGAGATDVEEPGRARRKTNTDGRR